jgi:histidyl-tRNA synthetase
MGDLLLGALKPLVHRILLRSRRLSDRHPSATPRRDKLKAEAMAKDKAPKNVARRPRAETPKGFRDYFGADVTERKAMLDTIAEVYHRYGFDPLETSAVETVEALGKYLPDVDRPNEGVFAWQDEDEDWLALRYDLTAPLARVAAQYRNELPTPYRRYAMGPVWRNEKPGPGRFRQFYQCDADTVGAASVAADAEICAMLADALEAVGIPRGDYVVRVNNRKVLNGVMEVAGILDPADPNRFHHERGIVLRAIDKLDRLGPEGVRALLGEGRKDESGDFTSGAGLEKSQIEALMRFVGAPRAIADELFAQMDIADNASHTDYALQLGQAYLEADPEIAPLLEAKQIKGTNQIKNLYTLKYLGEIVGDSKIGREGVNELKEIAKLLIAQGYGADRIVIDPSVVRGLGYYTGPVFEAELTFPITDDKGRPCQFGSVAGGGRYDALVKRFTGQSVPATGVSIGVDRLLAALRAKGRSQADTRGPVVVTVMDRDRMADYQAMATDLRRAGIRAEVYLGNPRNFGNQLKYADKRQSPVAVIQGADEAAKGTVILKDLILGAKIAAQASHEEWKSQPAQTEVARADLVAAVRQLLDRA